jgi:hypothetical protein
LADFLQKYISPSDNQKRINLFSSRVAIHTVSPTLVTWASPLFQAAAAVSGAVLHGAEGAFDKLLHIGENAPSADNKQAYGDSIEDLQVQADLLSEKLQNRSLARLAEAGIPLAAPLALQSDALGDLRVTGDYPQAAAIERILADDPQLAELVEELQAIQAKLARHRRAAEVDRLVALDPTAAGKLLDERSPLDEAPVRVTLRRL